MRSPINAFTHSRINWFNKKQDERNRRNYITSLCLGDLVAKLLRKNS